MEIAQPLKTANAAHPLQTATAPGPAADCRPRGRHPLDLHVDNPQGKHPERMYEANSEVMLLRKLYYDL